jgi:hypothetical protein
MTKLSQRKYLKTAKGYKKHLAYNRKWKKEHRYRENIYHRKWVKDHPDYYPKYYKAYYKRKENDTNF